MSDILVEGTLMALAGGVAGGLLGALLASGLRRPLGCVWPEVDAEAHPGHLTLFVADKDMSKAKPEPWPLLPSIRMLCTPACFSRAASTLTTCRS